MVLGLSKQVADAFLPELLKFKTVIFGLNTELNDLIDGQYIRDLMEQLLTNERNQHADEIDGNQEIVNEETMDISDVSTASSSSVMSIEDQ
uniref:PABC domain-containing protein n=1 Tax=Panagrellus redivivus TaxID=6233 RepID=A0A7E4USR6_PANRE